MPPLDTAEGRRLELDRLLAFAEGSATGDGRPFGYLDATGRPDPDEGYQLWVNARMTHVFALASMLERPGARERAEDGVAALRGAFHDDQYGGWYGRLGQSLDVRDDRKTMYEHAFVLLSAATSTTAGVSGARELLDAVISVVDAHFWDDAVGACRESWSRDWTDDEAYRGANSNMHAVEAFLTTAVVTGDAQWTERALRIAERLVHQAAASYDWRLPEHFTSTWDVDRDYNIDVPRHQFRPFGVTIGHLLEWSRLLVHLDTALGGGPGWVMDAAGRLFETAMAIGWEADGHPGFVYTLDWQDRPVVAERMHWVAVEAAMTAHTLARRTGDERFADWEAPLWRAVEPFVDRRRGSWHHELDASGAVSTTVWTGKPDVYHAVQGMLLPDLPLTPSVASGVASRVQSRA